MRLCSSSTTTDLSSMIWACRDVRSTFRLSDSSRSVASTSASAAEVAAAAASLEPKCRASTSICNMSWISSMRLCTWFTSTVRCSTSPVRASASSAAAERRLDSASWDNVAGTLCRSFASSASTRLVNACKSSRKLAKGRVVRASTSIVRPDCGGVMVGPGDACKRCDSNSRLSLARPSNISSRAAAASLRNSAIAAASLRCACSPGDMPPSFQVLPSGLGWWRYCSRSPAMAFDKSCSMVASIFCTCKSFRSAHHPASWDDRPSSATVGAACAVPAPAPPSAD
mmetsp:Transcript_3077/g.8757  ORF Transcript_3077/g.8757 Transcript_3077/m.8757 type:complete len:284 (+) Transcript_3077:1296-2147(+)